MPDDFAQLVRMLVALPAETEWVEFKENNCNPEKVGNDVSALSNSALLQGKTCAYIVWGVRDGDHAIVGTSFHPRSEKVKKQEFENWLVTQLDPKIDVRPQEGQVDGKHVVVFEIQRATHQPVGFKGRRSIRIGSYTKPLSEHPEKERQLWALLSATPFEDGIAEASVTSDDVLDLIDYPACFQLLQHPLPADRAAILARLEGEGIIRTVRGDRYDITNLGGILFARSLGAFRRLSRKALRVVVYSGDNKANPIKEQVGDKGYAVGFQGAVEYINNLLPQNEQIEHALRREVRMYPDDAVRELVANALIHQELNVTGAGPLVEVFDTRLEISNPGRPLIDTLRFIDEPPRSRNEGLARLMRRMNICEERGSGIVRVVIQIEAYQLPAPDFRATESSTLAILFAPRSFSKMDREERIRACYQHACLMCVSGKQMTNATLRKRLGLRDDQYTLASAVISDAREAGLIRQAGSGRKYASYLPFWTG